jgi:simple sugar transport system permease protein
VTVSAPAPPAAAPESPAPLPPAWLDLLVNLAVRALVALLAVLAVALAWVLAVVLGGGDAGSAVRALARSGLLRPDSVAAIASAAAPLLLAGLAMAIALRAGLVNLGVQGQALAGALAAGLVAERLHAPAALLVPLVMLAGMGAGLAWALLPALLRVWRGVPELLSTVLASYLAVAAVAALRGAATPRPVARSAGIGTLAGTIGRLAPGATWSGLLTWTVPAVLLAVLAWTLVLHRTRVGLLLRVRAAEPRAAHLAGLRPTLTVAAVLLLSGAVAGLAGLQDVLGHGAPVSGGLGATGLAGLAGAASPDATAPTVPVAPVALAHLPDYGLLAVAVALAGRASGLGMTAAALALALLDRAGLAVSPAAGPPAGWVTILQAVLVVAAVGAARLGGAVLARWELRQPRRRAAGTSEAAGSAGPAGKAEGVHA